MSRIKQAAPELDESALKAIEMDLVIENEAIYKVAAYLEKKIVHKVIIVADDITYEIAGRTLEETIDRVGIANRVTIIKPNSQGDVIADEASIIQLIIDIQQFTPDIIIAAGSGTIHDISRYAAYTTGIPFVSVPTAPSVDGFNSKGAPIILRGEKKTIQAIGPDAIFADLSILTQAPRAMVAAGFGDMIGKYTSLFDWKFGSIVAGEPYSVAVADITRNALQSCVEQVERIAERQEDGIRTLISSLIESGLAMLLFGQSHSASGAEHHLSHYWEMEYIRLGKRQLLHGAKVGVACIQISRLYHQLAASPFAEEFSADATDKIQVERIAAIHAHWEEIQQEVANIPDAEVLASLLHQVGGPIEPTELGIEQELLDLSLREAHHVRMNRFTLLRARNELTN
ncbi:sn-glycerol-1-phosphate dehydrogenase [Paenibacillus sp. FA6]|uniref:sn-glycerol-1-phosphate dehydrogenase n=1 Tax=Paenibacillus sp. FA6 TaxID=3413029 RepID=UPI003F659539